MKNIADVNSDDILTELNNLDYGESDDDLKLLDDEDIRPINNKQVDDDLSDFYMDYSAPKKSEEKKVDLYTEKLKQEERPLDKYIEKANKLVEQPKNIQTETKTEPKGIDAYLNRNVNTSNKEQLYNQPKQAQSVQSVYKPQPKVNPISSTSTIKPQTNNYTINASSKTEVEDLNQLFNKVSNNVKGASEIVNRNAEIKKKIEAKFDELRRLQQEHEANKKKDYDEINAYKDDVMNMIQQKKSDMEKDLSELRVGQEKLEKEKKSFEDYKNNSLLNLNKLEKELKDSYESRNKNIEQVELGLVKRKEQLDIERASIAKEREQVKKEKEELARNLVQFNKLVSEFTQGMDNFE